MPFPLHHSAMAGGGPGAVVRMLLPVSVLNRLAIVQISARCTQSTLAACCLFAWLPVSMPVLLPWRSQLHEAVPCAGHCRQRHSGVLFVLVFVVQAFVLFCGIFLCCMLSVSRCWQVFCGPMNKYLGLLGIRKLNFFSLDVEVLTNFGFSPDSPSSDRDLRLSVCAGIRAQSAQDD